MDVLENTGTSVNVVYIPDKEELVYINDAAQLVKAEKGKKTFIADSLRDGSLSLIKNTDEMLTYIADGRQHYIKNTSSKPVEICEAENMVNTSNKKNHTQKSKNYDEGVFDITKVDFGEVADKLKSEKDKIVASGNKLLKAVGEKAKNGKQIDKGGKNSDNINSSNNENVNISGNNDNNSNNINGKKRGNINNNRDKKIGRAHV